MDLNRLGLRSLVIVALTAQAVAAPSSAPDFNREVRPILARNCFKCHGPDEKARKAKLRLDAGPNAFQPTRSGKIPIVPGKPEESELIARVFNRDPDDVMPPTSTKLTLTEDQKETLKRWVAAGAEYVPHWAFVKPKQVPLPAVSHSDWPRNAIDYFILARLEKEGLDPSPPADRCTLVRRVYLDLIGLPPTPLEADAFVNDAAPDAYEKLVDGLLASPHYGERWARKWLDLARYADTNGYEKDRPRSMWPWRDWVIRAFNADLPFDQFTIDQIAGDMLPNPTPDQIIATGFHRNTMLNEEGGIDPLEFRFLAMTDRMATTAKTWIGLTVQCAQCHTHKYDPIPHREYYQLMAFLNNADEPPYDVKPPEYARQCADVEARIRRIEADLPNRFEPNQIVDGAPMDLVRRASVSNGFARWLERESAGAVEWHVLRPSEAKANLPFLTILPDQSVLASGDQTKADTYWLKFRAPPGPITAIQLEALPDDGLPRHGPGRAYYEGPPGDFNLSDFRLRVGTNQIAFSHASHSYAAPGFAATNAIDDNLQTGWAIDGGQGRRHTAVFNLAQPLVHAEEFEVELHFERHFCADLGRFRIAVTSDPRLVTARDVPPDITELLLVPAEQRTDDQQSRLRHFYLTVAPELAEARVEIAALRAQLPVAPTTLVMAERPPENPRPTFVHNRGEFLQPTERVEPAVLSILNPLPPGAPRSRLGFAQWLVSRDNPLAARVVVNRQWAAFFGRGIVRTVEDFGYQGDPPSHPELLDWLAVEFMNQGWSLKRLHKLIVLSATYQQSSRVTPELMARDAANLLLARTPRLRLEAEMIRDSLLRIAGLLTTNIGGPSVFPPQPASVTTDGAYGPLTWKVSEGPDRYRRGLYTFSKRTAPYAMFSTFDGPSGEACVAQRDVSDTPLQALTLLNDTVIVEAAQALGHQFATQTAAVECRLEQLFRRCLVRYPDADERRLLAEFLNHQRQRFANARALAEPIAGKGAGDPTECAAWTALARVLLNLDETVTRN